MTRHKILFGILVLLISHATNAHDTKKCMQIYDEAITIAEKRSHDWLRFQDYNKVAEELRKTRSLLEAVDRNDMDDRLFQELYLVRAYKTLADFHINSALSYELLCPTKDFTIDRERYVIQFADLKTLFQSGHHFEYFHENHMFPQKWLEKAIRLGRLNKAAAKIKLLIPTLQLEYRNYEWTQKIELKGTRILQNIKFDYSKVETNFPGTIQYHWPRSSIGRENHAIRAYAVHRFYKKLLREARTLQSSQSGGFDDEVDIQRLANGNLLASIIPESNSNETRSPHKTYLFELYFIEGTWQDFIRGKNIRMGVLAQSLQAFAEAISIKTSRWEHSHDLFSYNFSNSKNKIDLKSLKPVIDISLQHFNIFIPYMQENILEEYSRRY